MKSIVEKVIMGQKPYGEKPFKTTKMLKWKQTEIEICKNCDAPDCKGYCEKITRR